MTVSLRIDGEGPAVVFLHGTPTTPDVFAGVAREIAHAHRTVQIALPGYGKSSPLPDGWTYADMHEALERTLHAAGVHEAVFVGFSGGGYHSLAIATRGIFHVQGVVTLGAFASMTKEERSGYVGLADHVAAGGDVVDIAHAKLFSREWAGRPGMRDVTAACMAAVSPAYLAAELRQLAVSEDLLPKLASLHIPVVARHGTADETVLPAKSEAVSRAAPNAVYEPVPGKSHMLLVEDFEGTLSSIRRLLARVR